MIKTPCYYQNEALPDILAVMCFLTVFMDFGYCAYVYNPDLIESTKSLYS